VLVAQYTFFFCVLLALQSENQPQTTSKTGPWRKVSLSLREYLHMGLLVPLSLSILFFVGSSCEVVDS